jgi:LIM domain kinase 1
MSNEHISRPGKELLLNRDSEYSTTVIKSQNLPPPSLSSILTIKPSPDLNRTPDPVLPATPPSNSPSPEGSSYIPSIPSIPSTIKVHTGSNHAIDVLGTSSLMSIASLESYHTAASSSIISSTYATEGGSTIRSLHGNYVAPLVHRFTLLKPGAKQKRNSNGTPSTDSVAEGSGAGVGWNPLEMFFSSGLLVGKCDLCNKRIGWKPVLECDDCGLRFFLSPPLSR